MKLAIVGVCLLAAVALAHHDGDHKPQPRPPRFPFVRVRPHQVGEKGKSLVFRFAVINFSNSSLSLDNLHFKKFNFRNRTLEDADFEVNARVVNRDDIEKAKEHLDKLRPDYHDHDGDRRPRPKPQSAIIGNISSDALECDDRGLYLLAYGKRPDPRDEDFKPIPIPFEEDRRPHPKPDPRPHPRPHPRPVAKVGVFVRGCPRPHFD